MKEASTTASPSSCGPVTHPGADHPRQHRATRTRSRPPIGADQTGWLDVGLEPRETSRTSCTAPWRKSSAGRSQRVRIALGSGLTLSALLSGERLASLGLKKGQKVILFDPARSPAGTPLEPPARASASLPGVFPGLGCRHAPSLRQLTPTSSGCRGKPRLSQRHGCRRSTATNRVYPGRHEDGEPLMPYFTDRPLERRRRSANTPSPPAGGMRGAGGGAAVARRRKPCSISGFRFALFPGAAGARLSRAISTSSTASASCSAACTRSAPRGRSSTARRSL